MIAMALDWDKPYWAAISVVLVMMTPYIGGAYDKGIQRIVGTLMAAVVCYMLYATVQEQWLFMLLLLFFIGGMNYESTGPKMAYSFLLCSLTIVITTVGSMQDVSTMPAQAFYRCQEITLGVLVAWVVNALFWTENAGVAMRQNLAGLLRDMAHPVDSRLALLLGEGKEEEDHEPTLNALVDALPALHTTFLFATHDSLSVRRHQEAYADLVDDFESLASQVLELTRTAKHPGHPHLVSVLGKETALLRDMLRDAFADLAKAIEANQAPRADDERLQACRDGLYNAFNHERKRPPAERHYSVATISYYEAVCFQTLALIDKLIQTRAHFGETLGLVPRVAKNTASINHRLKGWRPDRERVKLAIKAALGVMGAIYCWLWLNWPGGVTGVITVTIVLQTSVAATNQKSMLRIKGCLLGGVGAAFALYAVIPHLQTGYGFALMLFALMLPFSYINAGSPRIAYMGMQANLAMLLTLAPSLHEQFSIWPAIDRFLGILLGVFWAAAVLRLVWPVIPERTMTSVLADFYGKAADLFDAMSKSQPGTTAIAELHRELEKTFAHAPRKAFEAVQQIRSIRSTGDDVRPWTRFVMGSQSLAFHLNALAKSWIAPQPEELTAPTQKDWAMINRDLAALCRAWQQRLVERKPLPLPTSDESDWALLDQHLFTLIRERGVTLDLPITTVAPFMLLLTQYRLLSEQLNTLDKPLDAGAWKRIQRHAFL